MSVFNKINEANRSVNKTLDEMRKPKINQTTVFSMRPAGLYGTVYEDPRGLNLFRFTLIAGVILGVIVLGILGSCVNNQLNGTGDTPDYVAALSTPVDRSLPVVNEYMIYDNASIYDYFNSTQTIYTISSTDSGIDVVRLPADISVDDLAAYYALGFSEVDTQALCNFLANSWEFSTNFGSTGITMKVKYADFTSGSVDGAILQGINTQGFTGDAVFQLDAGTDDAGNTYRYGTMTLEDGSVQYWRVAAVPVTDVYYNAELPSDGAYVGVTVSTIPLMTIKTEEETAAAGA